MIEQFPVLADSSTLHPGDFRTFSDSFAEIIIRQLPSAKNVFFIHSLEELQSYTVGVNEDLVTAPLVELFQSIIKGDIFHAVSQGYLLVSFNVFADQRIVALVEGADSLFLQRLSEDWLLEICGRLEHEFLLLKKVRIDLQTGLLNLSNLYSLLENSIVCRGLHLILVELPPKRSTFQTGHRYGVKCVRLLKNFVRDQSSLHYLGQSTFALVFHDKSDGKPAEIESALVNYLKKEGCHRVHVGSSRSTCSDPQCEVQGTCKNLLDEAWTSLLHAEKRGPFSFCDYQLLAFPEAHPLAPAKRGLVRKLSRLWSSYDSFSLFLFRDDKAQVDVTPVISPHLDKGKCVTDGRDLYLVLEGIEEKEYAKWIEKILQKVAVDHRSISISVGISCYPYGDYKKTELPLNCRKALLHGAFFGPSSVVVFDQTSLNISGDIYFGDGDFTKAIAEYRRGVRCGGGDVNLYNSLGVTLAMMGRFTPAIDSFNSALDFDKTDFMALYNLGLAKQAKNEKQQAFHYLQQAYENREEKELDADLILDLQLQLGILSVEIEKYQIGLSYLNNWLESNEQNTRAGKVYYYLGRIYHELGDTQSGMSALQKALRYDEFDDRAMSLLGRMYLKAGQGVEIALTLCQKSVEMEPQKLQHQLYVAEVLIACGKFEEAKKYLYRCLRNKKYKILAQLALGKGYFATGQLKRAVAWYDKVLHNEEASPQALKEAEDSCLLIA